MCIGLLSLVQVERREGAQGDRRQGGVNGAMVQHPILKVNPHFIPLPSLLPPPLHKNHTHTKTKISREKYHLLPTYNVIL